MLFVLLSSIQVHFLLVVVSHFSLVVLVVASAVGAELTGWSVFAASVKASPEGDVVGEFFFADITDKASVLVVRRGAVVLELQIVAELTLFFLLEHQTHLLLGFDAAISGVSHSCLVVASRDALAHPVGLLHRKHLTTIATLDIFICFVPSGLGSILVDHLTATFAPGPVFVLGGEGLAV